MPSQSHDHLGEIEVEEIEEDQDQEEEDVLSAGKKDISHENVQITTKELPEMLREDRLIHPEISKNVVLALVQIHLVQRENITGIKVLPIQF